MRLITGGSPAGVSVGGVVSGAAAGSFVNQTFEDGRLVKEDLFVAGELVRTTEYGYDATEHFLDEKIVTDS